MLATTMMLVMREFVFDYWRQYFKQRTIERAIKSGKEKQKLKEKFHDTRCRRP